MTSLLIMLFIIVCITRFLLCSCHDPLLRPLSSNVSFEFHIHFQSPSMIPRQGKNYEDLVLYTYTASTLFFQRIHSPLLREFVLHYANLKTRKIKKHQ